MSLWQRTVPLLKKAYKEEHRVMSYDLRRNVLKICEELKRSFRALYMTVTNLSNGMLIVNLWLNELFFALVIVTY